MVVNDTSPEDVVKMMISLRVLRDLLRGVVHRPTGRWRGCLTVREILVLIKPVLLKFKVLLFHHGLGIKRFVVFTRLLHRDRT